jgi:hypothetical protein
MVIVAHFLQDSSVTVFQDLLEWNVKKISMSVTRPLVKIVLPVWKVLASLCACVLKDSLDDYVRQTSMNALAHHVRMEQLVSIMLESLLACVLLDSVDLPVPHKPTSASTKSATTEERAIAANLGSTVHVQLAGVGLNVNMLTV